MTPPSPIIGPIVIAGYFPWRRKGVEFWDDVRRRPLLGSYDVDGHFEGYDQGSPENTRVSCRWAKDYGISCLAHVWRGSQDFHMTPKVATLQAEIQTVEDLRWCIFLGNMLPLSTYPDPDFNDPAFRHEWVKSMTSELALHGWLSDERYLTIDGKPVVLCFRGHLYEGDFQGAIQEVYDFWGQQIYLIGMTGRFHTEFDDQDTDSVERISAFDACTAWSATAGTPPEPKHLTAVASFVGPRMQSWRDGCEGLGVDFLPTATFQYDKTGAGGSPKVVRFARHRQDFAAMVDAASAAMNEGRPAVWIQTFDEHPEGTSACPMYPDPALPYQDAFGFDAMEEIQRIREEWEGPPDWPGDGAACCINLSVLGEEIEARSQGRALNRTTQALIHCDGWDTGPILIHLDVIREELEKSVPDWPRVDRRFEQIRNHSLCWRS